MFMYVNTSVEHITVPVQKDTNVLFWYLNDCGPGSSKYQISEVVPRKLKPYDLCWTWPDNLIKMDVSVTSLN